MKIELTETAEEDLGELEKEQKKRVLSKLEELENKLKKGFSVEKVIEKRLKENWYPILQHRVGKLRCWFIEGEEVDRDENNLLVLRILTKKQQISLKNENISPKAYL